MTSISRPVRTGRRTRAAAPRPPPPPPVSPLLQPPRVLQRPVPQQAPLCRHHQHRTQLRYLQARRAQPERVRRRVIRLRPRRNRQYGRSAPGSALRPGGTPPRTLSAALRQKGAAVGRTRAPGPVPAWRGLRAS
ncbi:unnamed protein product [Musa acuminata subsp. malaccensis]|uniref:(wild Malaysian banana) hypothetical protein n=1 Tax=Musa acuminata subsp. malaccensis TaxID=214687 RepID=A0A804K8X7_MUSAM|nr:unnamed protein product [Musa acuminata subsp. malaccensis]